MRSLKRLKNLESKHRLHHNLNLRKNILISPLEWGLGHAARMIPVAKRLSELNNNVIIAAGESHLALFRKELPGLQYINFKGFSPQYSRWLPQYLSMLIKTPVLVFYIISDHYRLKRIIKQHNIDIVISDNRFGLWNRKVKCIYITHMPRIPLPKFFRIIENAGVWLHRYIIRKYTLCFIPDVPGGTNLSGRLSHGVNLPANVSYIGFISRFQEEYKSKSLPFTEPYNAVILSGPEPQRGIFREKILRKLSDTNKLTVIFEGKPESDTKIRRNGNIVYYNHLEASEMEIILRNSDLIISRSGYTTIMDLVCLGKPGLLVPTPGQTEQEYLAEYTSSKKWFACITQDEIENHVIGEISFNVAWDDITAESKILFNKALRDILKQENEH